MNIRSGFSPELRYFNESKIPYKDNRAGISIRLELCSLKFYLIIFHVFTILLIITIRIVILFQAINKTDTHDDISTRISRIVCKNYS